MSDIDDASSSNDPLRGHQQKMKIKHVIAKQKINFKKRKPSANATSPIIPVRSASEHRSEVEPVASRRPLGRSFGRENSSGDVITPETNEVSPGRSGRFSEEPTSSSALRSYESPIGNTGRTSGTLNEITRESSRVTSISTANEINNSDRTSPVFTSRNSSSPVIDNDTRQDNTIPPSDNQLVEKEERYPGSDVRSNDATEDTFYLCSPCYSKQHGCCWIGILGFIIALISILCILWIWYHLPCSPPACGYSIYPRNTHCNNPRWII